MDVFSGRRRFQQYYTWYVFTRNYVVHFSPINQRWKEHSPMTMRDCSGPEMTATMEGGVTMKFPVPRGLLSGEINEKHPHSRETISNNLFVYIMGHLARSRGDPADDAMC